MQIAIINQSKIPDDQVNIMTMACSIQMQQHLSVAWGMLPLVVQFYADKAKVPCNAYVIVIFDKTDDVADAGDLGYHTEDSGVIYGRVFAQPVLDNGGVVLYDDQTPSRISVASVLSHEVAELYIDPYVNLWADGPTINEGCSYAYESCDPVENDSYPIDVMVSGAAVRVSVSNFVMPLWFNIQAKTGPYDYLNKLRAPFTMTTDGYMVVRNAAGEAHQIYGERYPDWRTATKKSGMARTARRSAK